MHERESGDGAMSDEALKTLLEGVRSGRLSVEKGLEDFKTLYRQDLGFATLDLQRESRVGYPEVVFGAGKTPDQVVAIAKALYEQNGAVLVTRTAEETARRLASAYPEAAWNPAARTVALRRANPSTPGADSYIALVSAGTSDFPVAEEARVTAEFFGSRVLAVTDVGVAGIHRLFARLDEIRGAKVVIAVAGMEGALASVLGGLVRAPVVAVPTSVGYGANLGGLSALLAMLSSCAAGVSVVNIDNGFGAGYLADMLNKL
jgi:NCAIR mutase (PurE)-related protein